MLHSGDCFFSGLRATFCPECKKCYKPKFLKAHMACEKCNIRLQYQCLHCGVLYVNLKTITNHVNDLNKKYLCDHCEYETGRKNNIERHIRCMHIESRKCLMCSGCGKIYKYINRLQRHQEHCRLTVVGSNNKIAKTSNAQQSTKRRVRPKSMPSFTSAKNEGNLKLHKLICNTSPLKERKTRPLKNKSIT